jgi:DNA-directed RNA polymerase specialized sigma24 family protein
VLAGWLFHVTAVASRKLVGQPRRGTGWRWFRPRPRELPPGATWWSRVAPGIDAAMDRLPTRPRNAVLLRLLLNQSLESVIRTLRTSERRATRRVERGLRKLTRRIRQRGDAIDAWISSSRRWV